MTFVIGMLVGAVIATVLFGLWAFNAIGDEP